MNLNKLPFNTWLFGNRGIYSATVFNHLMQEDISVSRIFCASSAPALIPKKLLPVDQPAQVENLESLAFHYGVPIQHLSNQTETDSLNTLELSRPDFILVSCFPFRLPKSLIDWPILGCLNIHPSLLPRYRGPDPIFWQLYNNETQTGVSLHIITSGMDTGAIVRQKMIPLEMGASRQKLETTLAKIGAKLFTTLLINDIAKGITGKIQDESNATYYPNPTLNDYDISSEWSAKHAFNFIRGTCSPTGFYIIHINGNAVKIKSNVNYTNDGNIAGYIQKTIGEIFIQFSPGILYVKQADMD